MNSNQKIKSQHDRFVEVARELECDEYEDRFNETLKRVLPRKPKKERAPDD